MTVTLLAIVGYKRADVGREVRAKLFRGGRVPLDTRVAWGWQLLLVVRWFVKACSGPWVELGKRAQNTHTVALCGVNAQSKIRRQ